MKIRIALCLLGLASVSGAGAQRAHAFAQKAFAKQNLITFGVHEYLTAAPARELYAHPGRDTFPELQPTKRIEMERVIACTGTEGTKPDCDNYGATSFNAFSAVIGQRWVDMMGFTKILDLRSEHHKLSIRKHDTTCFNAVAQEADALQYDHFNRMRCDVGQAGRNRAIEGSRARVRAAFLEAVKAKDAPIPVVDGGTEQHRVRVSERYFLFGKAAHTFQDSFSREHTVRDLLPPNVAAGRKGWIASIIDVKSYVCTPGVAQHKHNPPPFPINTVNGDNPFRCNPEVEGKSCLETEALAAFAAMKDLWRAFILSVRHPDTAEKRVDDVLNRWLAYDPNLKPPAWSDAERIACVWGSRSPVDIGASASRKQVDDARKTCLDILGPNQRQPHAGIFIPKHDWSFEPVAVRDAILAVTEGKRDFPRDRCDPARDLFAELGDAGRRCAAAPRSCVKEVGDFLKGKLAQAAAAAAEAKREAAEAVEWARKRAERLREEAARRLREAQNAAEAAARRAADEAAAAAKAVADAAERLARQLARGACHGKCWLTTSGEAYKRCLSACDR